MNPEHGTAITDSGTVPANPGRLSILFGCNFTSWNKGRRLCGVSNAVRSSIIIQQHSFGSCRVAEVGHRIHETQSRGMRARENEVRIWRRVAA